ncbi:MAG: hypothetical protein P8M22_10795 [Phycisphaerales bacterium]|nr:hypothetical protein [Phycisphaerales bacterium]
MLLLFCIAQSYPYLVSLVDTAPRMQGVVEVQFQLDLDSNEAPLALDESMVQVGSWIIDRSAYVGLPRTLADNATRYVSRAIDLIGPESSPVRNVYELTEIDPPNSRGRLAYDSVPIQSVDVEPVPIVLLPSPDLVRAVQAWSDKHGWGDVNASTEVESFNWNESIKGSTGRTIYFEPGFCAQLFGHNYYGMTPPLPEGVFLAPFQFSKSDMTNKMGKSVIPPSSQYRQENDPGYDYLEPLEFDHLLGAHMLGRLISRPVTPQNPRLRQVQLEVPREPNQVWFSYALFDGIGELRNRQLIRSDGSSGFERPLSSPAHDPVFGRHSLLRLPEPIPLWKEGDLETAPRVGEEISLDEWFFKQGYPGVVLVSEASSTPLREVLRLEPGPTDLSSGESPLVVAAFPDAEPEQLVRLIQDAAVNAPQPDLSSEVMAELEQLHEAVIPTMTE